MTHGVLKLSAPSLDRVRKDIELVMAVLSSCASDPSRDRSVALKHGSWSRVYLIKSDIDLYIIMRFAVQSVISNIKCVAK